MPSAIVTAGRQPVASRNGRGSNQCASASWSTRKRVAGGSSLGTRPAPDALGRRCHAAGDAEREVAGRGGGTPAAAQICSSSDAHRQRLAVRDDERAAGERAVGRELLDGGDERVGRVVDVGRVDQRSAARDDEQPPRARPLDDAPDELRVARPPDRVRADRGHGQRGVVRRERERARPRPSTPSTRSGRCRDVIGAAAPAPTVGVDS